MSAGLEAMREAARLESARIYGTLSREAVAIAAQSSVKVPTAAALPARPIDTYYGPAPRADVAELIEALVPERTEPARVPRPIIEQAIARGEAEDAISERLGLPLATVTGIRKAMDRVSA